MVDFDINVTQEYWEEDQFDCEVTREGARRMDEIARRYQGINLRPDEEVLTIDESIEEYDLSYIGSGKTRVVINVPPEWMNGRGDCIAKIQWDPNYHQTAQEIDIWENANGRAAALLAPVVDRSEMKQWLLMPRAERYTGLSVKEAGRISRQLREGLQDEGYQASDIRRANVGRIDGRDVVIDYGSIKKR